MSNYLSGEPTAVEGLADEAHVAVVGEFRQGDVGVAGGVRADAGIPVERALVPGRGGW